MGFFLQELGNFDDLGNLHSHAVYEIQTTASYVFMIGYTFILIFFLHKPLKGRLFGLFLQPMSWPYLRDLSAS